MRKIRYGRLLVGAVELDRMPRPLTRVLDLALLGGQNPANG
jgi:hypothetical protein